ncbi:hypothetical protein P8H26_08695 [Pseudochrobactrum sp. sp1633]|uniref:hypothetical protein n=1 Tax=Pseudochrobactrum sp. sp1633 TaxID=3036706 RepID=UPI0025A54A9B|nr:hypothetical protein [Pseudochrobactrum sp. sp1633]MDM8345471.1 hypothetical protein [Pseudochrobactrum sp. sp1633]HWD13099.1 hypothetical protein [Pseudochrobactrum sp.]
MPYTFQIQSSLNQNYIIPNTSTLKNSFINYTIQGIDKAGNNKKSETYWISKTNPKLLTGNFSQPVLMYNPNKNLFFGDSEQIIPMKSPNQGKTGSVAGAFNFATSDISPRFIFKYVSSQYEIYLDDDREADKTKLTKKLVMDKTNSNRVLITDAEIIRDGLNVDDKWIVTINS